MAVPKRLVSTDAKIITRKLYEDAYGIGENSDVSADHPFFPILMHASEETASSSGLRERMEKFMELEIGKHFNLSFSEFLDQPTYDCELMFEVAQSKIEKMKPILDNLASAVNDAAKGK
jgi:hypothetical protein